MSLHSKLLNLEHDLLRYNQVDLLELNKINLWLCYFWDANNVPIQRVTKLVFNILNPCFVLYEDKASTAIGLYIHWSYFFKYPRLAELTILTVCMFCFVFLFFVWFCYKNRVSSIGRNNYFCFLLLFFVAFSCFIFPCADSGSSQPGKFTRYVALTNDFS